MQNKSKIYYDGMARGKKDTDEADDEAEAEGGRGGGEGGVSSVRCRYFPMGSCWRHILQLSYCVLYSSIDSTRSVIGYGPQGKEFFVSWGSGIKRVK